MELSSPAPLKLDWCPYEAAKYAVEHWHYSCCMPASKTVKIGVWEVGQFVGVVIFSWGSNSRLGQQFGLGMTQCCELTRVALDHRHRTPVSRILTIALAMLKRQSPGLRLVISYADCDQGHHGGIYAAGGWTYLGKVQLGGGTPKYRIHGKVMHGRSVGARGWKQQLPWLREHVDPAAEKVFTDGKHKYAMPLDADMRAVVARLHQPYPKRAGSADGGTSTDQVESGGSIPTPALCEQPEA